jgi:hypothetical protein
MDDRIRVVVSSANLYFHDWNNMSQVIWMQDFPLKGKIVFQQPSRDEFKNDFGEYLRKFVDI